MKVIAWIGKEPNQIALINKLDQHFDVMGVVYENRSSKSIKSYGLRALTKKVLSRLFFGFIPNTWNKLQKYYETKFSMLDQVPSLEVENINDSKVKQFSSELDSDLIIVSGTSLIKSKNLLTPSRFGIINLHTGLSPYVKGGPNCTNWCLSKGHTHLIGNTIMWINEGIDSGNLILTEQTSLNGNENFFEIHLKVMEHAHELYISAIKNICTSSAENIPQSEIGEGTIFYNKNWGLKAQYKLLINLIQYKKLYEKYKFEKVKTVC
ncbi:MAG: formyltransferase family protein [Bacteroidota bacterium]